MAERSLPKPGERNWAPKLITSIESIDVDVAAASQDIAELKTATDTTAAAAIAAQFRGVRSHG